MWGVCVGYVALLRLGALYKAVQSMDDCRHRALGLGGVSSPDEGATPQASTGSKFCTHEFRDLIQYFGWGASPDFNSSVLVNACLQLPDSGGGSSILSLLLP